MDHKIIVDSCCDVTPELTKEYGITTIPLTLVLGDRHITDDDDLDLTQFMLDMKNFKGKIGSAAPSPGLYRDAFIKAGKAFVVTLSNNLSGSYASAMAGKQTAEEESPDTQVHVFDSKSACAGEVLVALNIGDMIRSGLQASKIIEMAEDFIAHMKTYFVLDNIDNLLKNGRIGKITGKLISALNIKPLMGADADGNIALFSHARGEKQIIEKLADTIEKSGKDVKRIVIAHCNNNGLAEKLKDAIIKRYHLDDILIVPTRGISSIYANDKGIVMSF
jgi:EDD domain protein, DegV family